MKAIIAGWQKYTRIPVPILAIYALPHDPGPAANAAETEANDRKAEGQAKAFERGVPTARIVRIPHANHYVFLSNEADVLREMDAFIAGLK
jgi:pimeloyl-ACP methyl ester carboxylesterase